MDEDAKFRLKEADRKIIVAESRAEVLAAQLKEKDELLLSWMHSNEAFKRLAKSYGKKLGLADEQRMIELEQMVLDVAEEDPSISSPILLQRVSESMKARSAKK